MQPNRQIHWRLCKLLAMVGSAAGIVSLFAFNDYFTKHAGIGLLLLSATVFSVLVLVTWIPGRATNRNPGPGIREVAARPRPSSPPPKQDAQGAASVPDREPLTEVSDLKVLLLSSDKADRHGIVRHLKSWGSNPTICRTAARSFFELLEASKVNSPFQAVIVDRGQFDMDASQFSAAMRSEAELQHLYLILVGAGPAGSEDDQLHRLGYTRLLPVPLNKTLLFDALHSICQMPVEPGKGVVRFIDHYSAASSPVPLSILLAETNRSEQQRVKFLLQQQGHQVFLVDSGARVLDALDSHQFDLAIVAMDLREISGIEAFKLYRFTRVDGNRTPFILLLDDLDSNSRQRCAEAGVNAVLESGADSRQILSLVKKVILESGDQIDSISRVGGSQGVLPLSREKGLTEETALDRHRLMELEKLGGDTAFLSDLIDSFNRDNRHFLTQMELAVKDNDPARFRDLGHAIKDSAGSLGAIRLLQLGTAATRLHREDFHENASHLLAQITECCRLSNNALQNFLKAKDLQGTDCRSD